MKLPAIIYSTDNSEESPKSRKPFFEPTRLPHLMQHYTEMTEKRFDPASSYADLYVRMVMIEDRLRKIEKRLNMPPQ